MIIIHPLEVVESNGNARLQAVLEIDGDQKCVWFQVDQKYRDYLCWERSDAFVVGVLNYAKRHGHDIKTTTPMSVELYYQLEHYLIDAVCKNEPKFHRVKLTSEIASKHLPCAGAVGTGISCGIDSFYTITLHEQANLEKFKITHLTFNNVGSHGEGDTATRVYQAQKKRAEAFCQEFGYEFVANDSNIMDVVPQSHYFTHTYSSCFAVLALQKLFTIYYYASSSAFEDFNLLNTYEKACGSYDLLSLQCFSTQNLKFYSSGGNASRLEKTRFVADYTPSYKYLNVCVWGLRDDANCSCKCEKCQRTILTLDALGKLNLYREVFDVDYYYRHKQRFLLTMLREMRKGAHKDYVYVYPLLKSDISLWTRCKSIILSLRELKNKIARKLRRYPKLRSFVRKLLRRS